MSLLDSLDPVKEFIGWDKHYISDGIFRLHSKVTASILLIFSLIVTASQFLGDPIDCVVSGGDGNLPQEIMDTYC